MKKNLNVDRFQNGDIIPEAKSFEDWQRAGKERKPVWCNYKNDPKNGEMYGKLYNWFVVNDSRGLLNKNWQVPSRELWNKLFTFLGDREHIGNKLKSENGWDENGNGTDEYSFCGLPGGFRWDYGGFLNIGSYGYWWSSTDNSIKSVSAKLLSYKKNSIIEYGFPLGCGFSVRGVKIPH
jgi:uncharacterized protein (TIGR02145 family)